MSTIAVNAITDASGGTTASINGHTPSASNMTGRNRIINGAMMIDQRNAGASGTSLGYTVDRWFFDATQSGKVTWQQNAGSVTPPAGFTNYVGLTVGAAANVTVGAADTFYISQIIEGYNVADLGFGNIGAASITLSFWVRSSLTGTFSGSLANSAYNRSYPFTYTISAANTWEQKTVTIAGDTTGTWLTTNGAGLRLILSIGAGSTYSGTAGAWAAAGARNATGALNLIATNGATFYITGVQLEVGSTASEFSLAGGTYPQELQLCKRYYNYTSMNLYPLVRFNASGGSGHSSFAFETEMRSAPTVTDDGNWSTASGYAGLVTYIYSRTTSIVIVSNVGTIAANACVYASGGIIYFDAEL